MPAEHVPHEAGERAEVHDADECGQEYGRQPDPVPLTRDVEPVVLGFGLAYVVEIPGSCDREGGQKGQLKGGSQPARAE